MTMNLPDIGSGFVSFSIRAEECTRTFNNNFNDNCADFVLAGLSFMVISQNQHVRDCSFYNDLTFRLTPRILETLRFRAFNNI